MSAEITVDGLAKLLRAKSNNYRFTITRMVCEFGVHTVTVTEHRSSRTFKGENEDLMVAMMRAVELASEFRSECDRETVA